MSGKSTTMQNFIQIGLGVSVLRMRDFAISKWLGYFLVLEKGYSRDAGKLESGIPNIAVFDPLLTRHAIQRMRSGRVRIFNGNQWEPL